MAKKNWKLIGLVLLIALIACPMTFADKKKTGEASKIEKQMWESAKKLDFERAASLRDKLKKLKMSSTAKQIDKEMWEAAKKLDFERAAALRNQLKKIKDYKKKDDGKQVKGESERQIKKGEVPKPAMATLKKLAGRAEITEFAEEIEHGNTFYEASWKSRSGANIDVLVTKSGALVEIEEQVNKVPATVLKAALKAAGKKTRLVCEKKTMILYEVKFSKDNNRHELLITPDGRLVEEEVEKGKSDDEEDEDNMKAMSENDDDDDDDDSDDDSDDDEEDGDDDKD